MNDLLIETTVCHGCYAVIDAGDNYCRHCGTNLNGLSDRHGAAGPLGSRPVLASVVQRPKLSESPWVVLPLLFLVLGPLGVPLLWRSRQFSLLWKSDAHHGGRDGIPSVVDLVHLADVAGAAAGIGPTPQIVRRGK
jgi:hypothetical protein